MQNNEQMLNDEVAASIIFNLITTAIIYKQPYDTDESGYPSGSTFTAGQSAEAVEIVSPTILLLGIIGFAAIGIMSTLHY